MKELNLKVSDEVLVQTREYTRLAKVEKITPKGFYKIDGNLYTKFGSKRTSSIWDTTFLITDKEEIENYKNKIKLKNTKITIINLVKIENDIIKLNNILKELKGE